MNIGATIKKLRRSQNITQEQLSEYLNVTAQAVSRWETGTALPDITQVPALANVLNVSADGLLGVDIAAKEARIDEIIVNAWENYAAKGRGDEAIAILRNALKEYPNSYKLMRKLATCIHFHAVPKPRNTDEEKAQFVEAMKEIISLGEKILAECTDDEIRYSTIQIICYVYDYIGETDKAIALAEKMPNRYVSCEELLTHLYKGTQLHCLKQDNLSADLESIHQNLIYYNVTLDDGTHPFTLDERIAIQYKILDIYAIIYEDDNYGFGHVRVCAVHDRLARLYNEKGDTAAALKHLKLAAKHAIAYDTNFDSEKEYTCLLLRGRKFGNPSKNTPFNESYDLLETMKLSDFDPIRNDPAFIEIEKELRKYASDGK